MSPLLVDQQSPEDAWQMPLPGRATTAWRQPPEGGDSGPRLPHAEPRRSADFAGWFPGWRSALDRLAIETRPVLARVPDGCAESFSAAAMARQSAEGRQAIHLIATAEGGFEALAENWADGMAGIEHGRPVAVIVEGADRIVPEDRAALLHLSLAASDEAAWLVLLPVSTDTQMPPMREFAQHLVLLAIEPCSDPIIAALVECAAQDIGLGLTSAALRTIVAVAEGRPDVAALLTRETAIGVHRSGGVVADVAAVLAALPAMRGCGDENKMRAEALRIIATLSRPGEPGREALLRLAESEIVAAESAAPRLSERA